MGRLEFAPLRTAWLREAADFTQLLAEQIDQLGEAIGLPLEPAGRTEVSTAGGRRIDIVARGADDTTLVIENQYGRADHDHLTRGLAYAVAEGAQGLIVVAEEHRDEFRAVADYLNEVARTAENGISVWLVEAKAVRVGDGPWAPLFTAISKPNDFLAQVADESSPEWNGRDWHVNVGDKDPTFRSWNDYLRYGFMAAGGGEKWSRVLRQIPLGSRVFAYRSGRGYVGVGEVISEAVRFDQAVENATGRGDLLREAPDLEGRYLHSGEAADADEDADYVIGVRWLSDPAAEPVSRRNVFVGTACRFKNASLAHEVATKLGYRHGVPTA